METIWTIACGNVVRAEDFGAFTNPTLAALKMKLEKKGCRRTDEVRDFEIRFLSNEDGYDFWKGGSSVLFSELEIYEYPELALMINRATGHNYPIHLCLERLDATDRDNLTVFAVFTLAYQPRISRPIHAKWSMAWEITSNLTTRITYSEVYKLYYMLKEAKLLNL